MNQPPFRMTHTHTAREPLYESDFEDLLDSELDQFGNGEECRPLNEDGFIVTSGSDNDEWEYEEIDSENETLANEIDTLPFEIQTLPCEIDTLPSEIDTLPSESDTLPSESGTPKTNCGHKRKWETIISARVAEMN